MQATSRVVGTGRGASEMPARVVEECGDVARAVVRDVCQIGMVDLVVMMRTVAVMPVTEQARRGSKSECSAPAKTGRT